MTEGVTRRELLRTGVAGGAALYGLDQLGHGLAQAIAAPSRCGRLRDIEHVVIFIQENRSFDHYFGRYPGVRGFGDSRAPKLRDGSGLPVFAQPGYDVPGYGGHLYPFRLEKRHNGSCTHDLSHDWAPQHGSWNGGAMDGFVREHAKTEGVHGPLTMGYYGREDIPYYWALADAFTLCDGYYCSVLGPSDPNHLMSVSGTLDPAGKHGGPMLETLFASRYDGWGKLSWTTMPEQLRERGISWKVYNGADAFTPLWDPVFVYFKQYLEDPELLRKGLLPSFPAEFALDVARDALPAVSWIYSGTPQTEHPPSPPAYGEVAADQILSTLTSNPDVWRKTALFITWDENGGFFDHVRPPTAPPGTSGEYLTVSTLPKVAEGIRGPIGLGFRVPLLVVSPFSRGGFVCSNTFDHTSLLRFVETRFGAEVPNLSAWRRRHTGDLTQAFNFVAPDASVPPLPKTTLVDPDVLGSRCAAGVAVLAGVPIPPHPIPPNSMPVQETGTPRRPSGCPRPKRRPKRRRRRRRHRRRHRKTGRSAA